MEDQVCIFLCPFGRLTILVFALDIFVCVREPVAQPQCAGAARGDHARIAELQRALDEIVGKRDVMTSDEIIESIDIALPDPTIAFREETGRRQSDPDWDV